MSYHRNILLRTNGGRRRTNRKPSFVEGVGGGERVGKEEETESLILLFVVLDLLEGRWW